MTRYFLDTEFVEDGYTIELISIGLTCPERQESLYLQSSEFDYSHAVSNEFVREHVLTQLVECPGGFDRVAHRSNPSGCKTEGCSWANREQIAERVLAFFEIERYGKPEIWGYFADYDWVVFCQLWGKMAELPGGLPYYCRDIKQFADLLGNPTLPTQIGGEHNALADAKWNVTAYDYLTGILKAQIAQSESILAEALASEAETILREKRLRMRQLEAVRTARQLPDTGGEVNYPLHWDFGKSALDGIIARKNIWD